jgi:hypothetical protein
MTSPLGSLLLKTWLSAVTETRLAEIPSWSIPITRRLRSRARSTGFWVAFSCRRSVPRMSGEAASDHRLRTDSRAGRVSPSVPLTPAALRGSAGVWPLPTSTESRSLNPFLGPPKCSHRAAELKRR